VKRNRALDIITRGIRSGEGVLLLQTLAEFSSVAIGKGKLPIAAVRAMIDRWRAVLPVRPAENDDLPAALDAVKMHRISFWDAMLWAAARRVGVRYMLTEDLQDGFELDGVRFINPFEPKNDAFIDGILPG